MKPLLRRYGVVLLLFYALFFVWQTPRIFYGKMTEDEIEQSLGTIEKNLASAPEDDRQTLLRDLRAWGRADDGAPVYMLNLMRYHQALKPLPNTPTFDGTPEQSNAYYERMVTPLALKVGAYPIYVSHAQGGNLVGHEADADNWHRILVMRYPSRRSFFALLTDPSYGPLAGYKLQALTLDLVPTSAELVMGDLRFLVGAVLLIVYLGVGWLRAARMHGKRPSS